MANNVVLGCFCYQICDLLKLFDFIADSRQTSHTQHIYDNLKIRHDAIVDNVKP